MLDRRLGDLARTVGEDVGTLACDIRTLDERVERLRRKVKRSKRSKGCCLDTCSILSIGLVVLISWEVFFLFVFLSR